MGYQQHLRTTGPRLQSMPWAEFLRHARGFCAAHSVYSPDDVERLPVAFKDHWRLISAEARRRGQQLTLFDADAL